MNMKISRIVADPALVNRVGDLGNKGERNVAEYDPLLRSLIRASRTDFDGPGATLFDLQTDVFGAANIARYLRVHQNSSAASSNYS